MDLPFRLLGKAQSRAEQSTPSKVGAGAGAEMTSGLVFGLHLPPRQGMNWGVSPILNNFLGLVGTAQEYSVY